MVCNNWEVEYFLLYILLLFVLLLALGFVEHFSFGN